MTENTLPTHKQKILDDLIATLAELQQDHHQQTTERSENLSVVSQQFDAPISELENEIGRITQTVAEFFAEHRSLLVGDGTTAVTEAGELKVRKNPLSVSFAKEDEEALMKYLERKGLHHCIRIRRSIDKGALKKHRSDLSRSSKVQFGESETLTIVPHTTKQKATASLGTS